MAKSPKPAAPHQQGGQQPSGQQSGQGDPAPQQQGSTPRKPQQGTTVIRDWAAF